MTLAVQIDQPGGPEQMKLVDVQVGAPGPGEFRLDAAHGEDVWLIEADAAGRPARFVDHAEFGATRLQTFRRVLLPGLTRVINNGLYVAGTRMESFELPAFAGGNLTHLVVNFRDDKEGHFSIGQPPSVIGSPAASK